jgi:hypothetical protein
METTTNIYPKLGPKFKAKLLKALRSGDYKQTTHRLFRKEADTSPGCNRPVGYCCLGVACSISGVPDHLLSRFGGSLPLSGDYADYKTGASSYTKLFKWAFKQNAFRKTDLASRLAGMNDAGKTFLEIADWIEENV